VLAPFAGLTAYEIEWSAAVAAAVLLFAFILFALGWIGGRDAKLGLGFALKSRRFSLRRSKRGLSSSS
jgi:prepilin peptidase CpaA